ncbi:MAG: AMP-binding protein [Mycobacterium sp.]|nr:AMP-binding protein [Mycobacterium sp.]
MQIREHAEATPDKPAVILYPSGTSLTFGELESRANQLAHLFRRHGLREGDAVAILMENSEHFHTAMWGARRAGLYYVPINTHLTAAEAAYIIDNSAAKAVISSAALRPVLEGLAEHLPAGLPELRLIAGGSLDGWLPYPECAADQPVTPIDDEIEGDLLQYSSGTTGRPKGNKRPLPHLPPSEAPGLMTALVSIWANPHGQFVPVMFTRMLKLPAEVREAYDVSSLERVMHAAAPCPVEIKKQMIDWWGPIVDEYYASSEAHGSTLISAEEWLEHPGSVGRPMAGAIHILDENGEELPPGEPGEIYFETAATFEYLNDPEKTAASRSKHGWRTVGDIGYLDDDGYLYLTDRRHHMIISGGVNIYPQEAENLLVNHPRVMDAAVFGIPDEEMGQSVKGVVQLVDPAEASDDLAADLLTWLRERLAHYKCPRSISFEVQLPRTDTGKLYKQSLIEKYSRSDSAARD